jgi:hypothetical protein
MTIADPDLRFAGRRVGYEQLFAIVNGVFGVQIARAEGQTSAVGRDRGPQPETMGTAVRPALKTFVSPGEAPRSLETSGEAGSAIEAPHAGGFRVVGAYQKVDPLAIARVDRLEVVSRGMRERLQTGVGRVQFPNLLIRPAVLGVHAAAKDYLRVERADA